jgi:hypothetical protein
MPTFYIRIRGAEEFVEWPDGQDLASLDEARREALESAREIISEEVLAGRPLGLDRVFEITDSKGKILATLAFADAMPSGEPQS